MTQRHFHDELAQLESGVLAMGHQARRQVELALKALETDDPGIAAEVVELDRTLDEVYLDLHNRWIVLTATQAPMGVDLRLMAALLHLLVVLERMGDQSANVAKLVLATGGLPRDPDLVELLERMGVAVLAMIDMALAAFAGRDATAGAEIRERDREVDSLYRQVSDQVVRRAGSREVLEWSTRMVMVGRALERAADQAVDVADQVGFILTGEPEIYPSGEE